MAASVLFPSQCLSVWNLHVLSMSAWVPSGYSGILPQSKDKQVRRIGGSEFPIDGGLRVSVCDCLSLYVSPVMNWRLVLPAHPGPCMGLAVVDNGWMDQCLTAEK